MSSKLSVNVCFFAVIFTFLVQIIVVQSDALNCYVFCSNTDAVSNLEKECGRHQEGHSQNCWSDNNTACMVRIIGGSVVFNCVNQEEADKCNSDHETGDAVCHVCNENLCNSPEVAEKLEASHPALGVKQCYKFTANRDRQVTIVNCPNPFKVYYECYAITDFDATTVDKGCVAVKSELEEDQIIVELCHTSQHSHFTACYMCQQDLCNLKNNSEPGAGFPDEKLNVSSNKHAYYPFIFLVMVFVKLL